MPIEREIVADSRKLSYAAAEQFVLLAQAAVHEKGVFTVALAGGSTPRELYALLADEHEAYKEQVPWDKIHFFWGDERHVPADSVESNYRMANEAMLAKVPVPFENVHRIKSENPDASKAANEYEQTIRDFFKLAVGQFPRFDLILLGVGADGHTASIFPGSDAINEENRLVVAPWIEKFKSYRITFTPPVLNNAEVVVFLVSGAEKATVVLAVLEGDYEPERFPVQLIRPAKGRVLWLMDREASRLLTHSE